MRLVATAAAYLASVLVVAAVAFVAVLFLAGPHAGLLPHWLEAVVLALGWLAVLVVPFFPARAVWRRLSRPATAGTSRC